MQDEKYHAADPSQLSGSSQGDLRSGFLHNSELRKKFEKLANWRIDPSLIEFPGDAREFRGGYATVSKALLASPSSTEGSANEPTHTTDGRPSSDARNLQPNSDTRGRKQDQQGRDEGADIRTAPSENVHTKEKASTECNKDEEQKSHSITTIPNIGIEASSSQHVVDELPDSGDRETHSQSNTEDNPHRKDEGAQGHQTGGKNDQAKEEARKEFKHTNEVHNRDDQVSQPKIVAVKKLNIGENTDLERVVGLALRELEILVQLSHPNVVELEGFVEDLPARKVWLIFPWEEHGNLRDFLAAGEWEIPERISLINDVTLGLEYLHDQEPPIYHGDLKSLNILVDSECHALITDLGSARYLRNDYAGKQPKENCDKPRPGANPSTNEEYITLEAFFSGTASTLTLSASGYTLRWAAPELLLDDKASPRSDIWALGWIAYEVMTNTIPFHDIKKDTVVIIRVIQGHLPSVTDDARMSLIRALCSLMMQCWSINPEERPTAEECRKLIFSMPMIVPAPTRGSNENISPVRHARLLNRLGVMYKAQGDYRNALECFSEASNIYATNGDSTGKAQNLSCLADLYLSRGDHAEAASFYTEARQTYLESGDEVGQAHAIWGLAEVRRLQEEYEDARGLYVQCLKIYSDNGARRDRARALGGLAGVHLLQEEYAEAEVLFSEALEVYTEVGDRSEAANAVWNLGEVHRSRHEHSEARKLYLEALEICTQIGDKHGRGTALFGLAEVHQAQDECNEATELFSEAAQIFADVGDKYWRSEALISLANTHRMQYHYKEAISLYTEAAEVLEEMGDSDLALDALEDAEDARKALENAAEDAAKKEGPFLASE